MTPKELVDWLPRAAAYIKKHHENPSGLIHPKERSKLNKLKKEQKEKN